MTVADDEKISYGRWWHAVWVHQHLDCTL